MENTNLVAKPIIKNQYWVVTDGDKKVGNVIAEGTGYEVKIGKKSEFYDSTKQIEKFKKIEFERVQKSATLTTLPPFATFPTTGKVYNSVLDIRKKLHLFTFAPKSKCFYAAGWFAIKTSEEFQIILCPKYIFVQRYPYKGPFKTEVEANSSINSL